MSVRQTLNSSATLAPKGTLELSLRLHFSSLRVFPCSSFSCAPPLLKLPSNTCDFLLKLYLEQINVSYWPYLRQILTRECWDLAASVLGQINVKPCANGRNIVGQQLPTLLDVTYCVRLHTLLHVVGCSCVLLPKVWNRSNFSANSSQHFFCSMIAEA